MSRAFASGSSQYLGYAGALVSAYPWTFGCWYRTTDVTTVQVIFSIGDTAASSDYWHFAMLGNADGDLLVFDCDSSSQPFGRSQTTTGVTVNTWHHCVAVGASASSRTVYIDGGSSGSNTTTITPSSLDTTSIGRASWASATKYYLDGLVAEAGLWNVALAATEIGMLADGFSPLMVRPDALVAYWPLIGRFSPEPDRMGAYPLTVTGATQSAHPRIIYPSRAQMAAIAASVGQKLRVSDMRAGRPYLGDMTGGLR